MFRDVSCCTCGTRDGSQVLRLNPGEVWMADVSSGIFFNPKIFLSMVRNIVLVWSDMVNISWGISSTNFCSGRNELLYNNYPICNHAQQTEFILQQKHPFLMQVTREFPFPPVRARSAPAEE